MEWYDRLHNEYINLFETIASKNPEDNGKLIPIRGIECGEGWDRHVENFLKSCIWIQEHNKPLIKLRDKPSIKIFQIKEKFGECRVYAEVQNGSETQQNQLDNAIAKLEGLCSVTCQECGTLQYDCIKSNGRWIFCLCNECWNNMINLIESRKNEK